MFLPGDRGFSLRQVTGVRYAPLQYQNKSGQRIEIILANLYGYYISSAYVPTMLLVTISYLTFYFSLEDFTNRVMVSLTSLLVLAALFSQVRGRVFNPYPSHLAQPLMIYIIYSIQDDSVFPFLFTTITFTRVA